MKLFKKHKLQSSLNRVKEEQLYEYVGKELQQGIKREGLWLKAIAKSNGNESLVQSLYIEYRIQSMIDSAELTQNIFEEINIQENETNNLNREQSVEERQRIKELKKRAKTAGAKYVES